MKILSRANRLNDKGQAMVEMALVISFLVLLVFGMTEFGRAMYTKNTLNNAARAGARVAIVTPASSYPSSLSATSVDCSSTPSNAIYAAVCTGIAGGGIQNKTVTVSIDIQDPGGNTQTAPASGYSVSVTVQASFDPVLALMKNMISASLSGEATMRYE
jgi:Flp pilus assembly protein TadG